MSDATTHLLLPYILAAQAQKHVTHNEALRILEGVLASTPRYPYALALAAASAFWSGKVDRAGEYALALQRAAPEFTPLAFTRTFGLHVAPVERFATALERIVITRA